MGSRDEVLRRIRDRLDKAGMKYEILIEDADSTTVRIDIEENGTGPIVQLEESLAKEGIRFDTGYDMVKRKRDWILDVSLEAKQMKDVPLEQEFKLHRDRSVSYREGDIFRFPLDDKGHFGYGRILISKSPLILVEFYGIVAKQDPPLEAFKNLDWVLRIYTGDLGIIQSRTWKVIGNLPVPGDLALPPFWLKDPVNGKLYLFTDPIRQTGGVETTSEEVRRLWAQPGIIFGHEMARDRVIRTLREKGVL